MTVGEILATARALAADGAGIAPRIVRHHLPRMTGSSDLTGRFTARTGRD